MSPVLPGLSRTARVPVLTAGALTAAVLAVGAVSALPAVSAPGSTNPSTGTVLPAPTLPTSGLDILLTNDDGWNAPGITAVRDALREAGHTVTVVAPATNQSGVSARVDFSGTLTATEQQPDTWSVSTSPAGTVLFALDQVLDEKPDLVVSGTNVGSNTGFDTNFSGTVGAATVASGMFDIPAVAISTATSHAPGAPGAFSETADLLVDMIEQGLPVLERGHVVNVNYPQLSAERPAPLGIRYAMNSQASAAAFTYVPQAEPGLYKIQGARGTEVPLPGTDTAELAAGWVTVGVLDADRSVAAADEPALVALLEKLGADLPQTPTGPTVRPWAQKLPKKVLTSQSQWLKLRGVRSDSAVTFTWKPVGGKGKKAPTKVTTAFAGTDLVAFASPARTGRYQVKLRTGGRTLRTGVVRVL